MKPSKLPLSVQVLLPPVLLLILVITIFVIAFKIGLTQITEKRETLTLATKNENILSQKEDLLSSVGANIAADTNLAITSLPSTNSILLEMSQLKSLAVTNNISLSNTKVSASTASQEGVASAEIILNANGDVASLVNYVSALKQIAPITHVSKVDLSFAGTKVEAIISVKTFWAALPTKLPAMLQPITGLNQAEKDLLSSLATLTLPKFGVLSPAPGLERANPFAE